MYYIENISSRFSRIFERFRLSYLQKIFKIYFLSIGGDRRNSSSRFTRNSEANASEFLENLGEMFGGTFLIMSASLSEV